MMFQVIDIRISELIWSSWPYPTKAFSKICDKDTIKDTISNLSKVSGDLFKYQGKEILSEQECSGPFRNHTPQVMPPELMKIGLFGYSGWMATADANWHQQPIFREKSQRLLPKICDWAKIFKWAYIDQKIYE